MMINHKKLKEEKLVKFKNLYNEQIQAVNVSLTEYLESTGLERREVIRITFLIEEALLYYQEQFGKEISFNFDYGKKWGVNQFSLQVNGHSLNPFDIESDEETPEILTNIMNSIGLNPTWKYYSGKNVISLSLPKKQKSPLVKLALSLLSAFVIWLVFLLLPDSFTAVALTYAVNPLFETFIGIISAISGPLIFCSVAYSIYAMGDITTFSSIGSKLIKSILCCSLVVPALSSLWLVFVYPPTSSQTQESSDGFSAVIDMILDIIPDNIFTAFTENNAMQIIFLAVVFGLATLILGKKVTVISSLIDQANQVFQYIMSQVANYVHILVFLGVLQMLLQDQLTEILSAYNLVIYSIISYSFLMMITIGDVCLRTKVSPIKLIKKLLPTFLIAFGSASSMAAYPTNVKCCKEKLGISDKLVSFGVPFGQVIYMLGFTTTFMVIGFFMANTYSVELSWSAIFIFYIMAMILSIAAPPVPGGALALITILLTQLGIPETSLSLAMVYIMLTDFSDTGFNIATLQLLLIKVAKKLNMLDEKVLKS